MMDMLGGVLAVAVLIVWICPSCLGNWLGRVRRAFLEEINQKLD